MGLPLQFRRLTLRIVSQTDDSHSNTSNNNGYKERLDSIEQIVRGLQGAVENRLGVIEKGLSSQQNEAIQKLTRAVAARSGNGTRSCFVSMLILKWSIFI